MEDDRIITDTCDTCREHAPGVLRHHNGTPVLFNCKTCDPQGFEHVSRRDVEVWLSGGPARF